MKLAELHASYTDLYQITMGQVFFQNGKAATKAVFDYYFRKIPYSGGYVIFAGLQDVLEQLENFKFSEEDLEYFLSIGLHKDYVAYLKKFEFTGSIYSVKEGEVVFPHAPILRVEASILEAQIIETFVLNLLNFQSLIATKAARIRQIAGPDKILSDFGLRRAHGLGGYSASRAAVVGGFDSTSNVIAAHHYQIPVAGTMAHSFVQSYDDELTAFRHYAASRPDNCILLVDTYKTLQSGVPNAIKVARELKAEGHSLKAIRLDSGDLAYLAKKARQMLDEAGFPEVKIAASNQLDEYVIRSLNDQKAPIDIFGVGTSLVTGNPDAALDGVYKLAFANGEPRIKLSENIVKTTFPHYKQVWRSFDKDGTMFGADAIALQNETLVKEIHHPFEPLKQMDLSQFKLEPLLQLVMKDGKMLNPDISLMQIKTYAAERLALLTIEYKRFQYPHIYKVGISSKLKDLRDSLISKYKNG